MYDAKTLVTCKKSLAHVQQISFKDGRIFNLSEECLFLDLCYVGFNSVWFWLHCNERNSVSRGSEGGGCRDRNLGFALVI